MAIQRFLHTHGVFSIRDFDQAFPNSGTDKNLLARAVARGDVDHPRRGVYISRAGYFADVSPEPLEVATCASDGLVFCGMTALRLHGVAHNRAEETHYYVTGSATGFSYAGHEYVPHSLRGRVVEQTLVTTPGGRSYRVTTEAQTIVDGAANLSLVGGGENYLRSLAGFGFVDVGRVVRLACGSTASARARLAWVLSVKADQWGVTADQLEEIACGIGRGPFYFTSSRQPRDTHWAGRWRLYLPTDEREMARWLSE